MSSSDRNNFKLNGATSSQVYVAFSSQKLLRVILPKYRHYLLEIVHQKDLKETTLSSRGDSMLKVTYTKRYISDVHLKLHKALQQAAAQQMLPEI